MSRKAISPELQATILRRSRRRCCICFGLNRDTSIKQGQIAHLDRNAENDVEDNLAFMCLTCHDKYDSTSSQSKNFTIAEVKSFRQELEESISVAFQQPVQFGEVVTSSRFVISGQYIRIGTVSDSAELVVRQLPNGQVRIIGEALFGTERAHGPNIGTLDFLADIQENVAEFEDATTLHEKPYRARILFCEGGLRFDEESLPGYFGMNVTFGGTYVKAP